MSFPIKPMAAILVARGQGEMAVSYTHLVSPSELSIKRQAIYRHGSQNNGPAYPGDDPREFWQRAEDRNRNTADLYNKLGMAEYEAMEVFVRYKHRK